jgi:uncharacterized membrane protein YfcA
LKTPQSVFDAIVPALVGFAALLLVVQNVRGASASGRARIPVALALFLQLVVAIYGGYFGAGMGIMMLALYAALGATEIHRMNAVKTIVGGAINLIASIAFVIAGTVDWKGAGLMTLGASIGGFAGASLARKANPKVVRWAVAGYGLLLAVVLAYRRWA